MPTAPDPPAIVTFVDMLGFKNLVTRDPDAATRLLPAMQPLSQMEQLVSNIQAYESGPLAHQFFQFHLALERRIREFVGNGISAITFSDSAFVHIPGPLELTAKFSSALMRDLIAAGVPARMGIAAGTFAALRFSSDTTTSARVHSAQFLGSAVVWAVEAESAPLKGLRILMHPSLDPLIKHQKPRIAYVKSTEPSPEAKYDLNYLYVVGGLGDTNGSAKLNERHQSLLPKIREMKAAAPPAVEYYYGTTESLLNRMRKELERLVARA